MKRRASGPTCLIIGAPGSGKSAALTTASAAAFAEIDGRVALHETASAAERKEWQALLSDWVKGRQPPSGVVVTVSVETLRQHGRETLSSQLGLVRKRLDEACEAVKAELPVWILVTKADLLPGFTAFMAALDEGHRRGLWGSSKASASGFDAIASRLAMEVPERLDEEPDPAARTAIFAFPQQFGGLRKPVEDVVRILFTPGTRRGPAPQPRGLYFASTAEGGYFLRDLLTGLIPAETGRAVSGGQRKAMLRGAAMAAAALASLALIAAWGTSFFANRALIAEMESRIESSPEIAGRLAGSTVSDIDPASIAPALAVLRDLPARDPSAGQAPIHEGFGLSQRAKLAAAAETAYGRALERQLRPRLLLRLEKAVDASIADPVALYEPLKAYLMLGGKAPATDTDMIAAWFERDWGQEGYPGGQNTALRTDLVGHLHAMLRLSGGKASGIELDRTLMEAAQRSLSRLDLAEFAWALVRSGTYAADLRNFDMAERMGPEAILVFQPADGGNLAALSIDGIYGWNGFNHFLLPQLSKVAQRVVEDQWIIGAGGARVDVEQQLLRVGPDLLDRYGKDFIAAWTGLLERIELKPLTADRPDYAALRAIAAPDSPLRLLVEAIATETALTQPARDGAPSGQTPLDRAAMMEGLSRIGIELTGSKSQNRAGAAFAGTGPVEPGANIEAQFRPFRMLIEGVPGRRPIDALIQNFADVRQSLLFAANTPSQSERARANLQLQVHNLRSNASRLPRQLAAMVTEAAGQFEDDAAEASVAQLSRLMETALTRPCKAIIDDAYPFTRASDRDVPLADFARLFAPGGEFDRFFAQNLAPLASVVGQTWQWKGDSRLGRELSVDTLRSFQDAARIREAYFPLAAGARPSMEITFTPYSLHGDADTALLDVNGQVVQSYRAGNTPVTVAWPQAGTIGGVSLALTPEIDGRANTLRFEGPWALLRLFDTGTLTRENEELRAQFVIGGRDVSYLVKAAPAGNPLALQALADFRCPEGL